jgi:predicted AlkP superfamily pyrophosphatase or phosphodiesterase
LQVAEQPILPEYNGANVRGIIPALVGARVRPLPAWLPKELSTATQVVVLVIDGLGWEQLQARISVAPVLSQMQGRKITTVAPSTTATALTSISTGLTPGEHGLVGYRMEASGETLNVLRWHTERGDARRNLIPRDTQPFIPFLGEGPPVITRAELEGSAFTEAHLRGSPMHGWRCLSSIAVEIGRQLRAGQKFVYSYYDGIDKIAHERGFGEFYDAELSLVDRLVADVQAQLPPGAALVVTADHGQVMVEDRTVKIAPEVLRSTRSLSGEGRFRWLHAKPGTQADLLALAEQHHAHHAWVISRERAIAEGWFGPVVSPPVAARYGDVALVPFEPISFYDPADTGPFQLVCRHGSLTSAEMYVPLLVAINA